LSYVYRKELKGPEILFYLDKMQRDTDKQVSKHIAHRKVVEPCCRKACLISLGFERAVTLVEQCVASIAGLTRAEKKEFVFEKIRNSFGGISKCGYLKFNWTVGGAPGDVICGVCRRCFCNVYGIGKTYLGDLCEAVKKNYRNLDSNLDDKTPSLTRTYVDEVVEFAKTFDISLSAADLGALAVPNTVASLTCFGWMKEYFDAVGDQMPNCCEIHLEPTEIKSIHAEYVSEMSDSDQSTLCYNSFLSMWHCCFRHVKIREYKSVSGKCKTCTLLAEARRKQLSHAGRK
jgi:hypothetical protein